MPHFFLKINYLFKHKSNFTLIIRFIFFQLKKPLQNIFRSREKKRFNSLINKKKITHNFFTSNCYDWLINLKNIKIENYLEIGAFEGLSLLFVNKNFKPKRIHAVDTWIGSNEHGKETIFTQVEKNYKFNTKKLKNLKNFKMKSDNFFIRKKNLTYNLIYIDGLHTRNQVYKDLENSLKLSNKKTIIVCDDFFWKFDKKFTQNLPVSAIVSLIKKYDLKIISITNNQIFLKL